MFSQQLYYTFLASLPALGRFDRVERLPITIDRLRARFRILPPEEAELLDRALRLLSWRYQRVERSDADTVALYREMMAEPRLTEIVTFRANLRTAVAALRHRHLGRPVPASPDELGPGTNARQLIKGWERPDFGLEHASPWLPELRAKLERGETAEAEHLLLSVVWDFLNSLPVSHGAFRFEACIVYLFKWDVVERWLAYSKEGAMERLVSHIERLRADYHRAIAKV